MKVCPECDGDGGFAAAGPQGAAWFDCLPCDGTGEVEHDLDDPYDVDGGVYPLSAVDVRPR